MAAAHVERRIYQVSALQLFGICATALGQMRAQIESQDVERGVMVATIGAGPLAPVIELTVAITAHDERQTILVATWRARKRGGDRHILSAFLDSVASLARFSEA